MLEFGVKPCLVHNRQNIEIIIAQNKRLGLLSKIPIYFLNDTVKISIM